MDQLKALHQKLAAKTTDELILDEIKRIQNMLLSYFEINPLKTTDTNVILYKSDEELMENMENLAKSANITYFEFYEMLRGYDEGFIKNKLDLLNDAEFIQKLLKLLFPTDRFRTGIPNLDLRVKISRYFVEKEEEDYDDYGEDGLEFEFSLKKQFEYKEGIHKIVDYLLNEQKKKEQEKRLYTKKPKDPNVDTFKLICEQVSNKYRESLRELKRSERFERSERKSDTRSLEEESFEKELPKGSEEDFDLEAHFDTLTLHEVNAYLTILGTFDKFDTIKYKYLYLNITSDHVWSASNSTCNCSSCRLNDIGLEYYEFTMEQQKILSQLVGIEDQTLQFKLENSYINIVFDKTNQITVSDNLLEKCKQKLEDSREKARKKLLTFVETNKTKIIETCCHRLKYYKSAPNNYKNKPFPIDNDFRMTGPLVSDPGIITPEVTTKVNKILEVEGFTVSIEKRFDGPFTINEKGEEQDLEPSVCKIECDTFYDSVSLAFPDSLTFPISIE